MTNIKGNKELEKEIRGFLFETKKMITYFKNKKYDNNKKEIDKDIENQKQLLKELDVKSEEVLNFKEKVQNEMINTIFDEMDELNEQLSSLRKESRRILNESSSELVNDASSLAANFSKVLL